MTIRSNSRRQRSPVIEWLDERLVLSTATSLSSHAAASIRIQAQVPIPGAFGGVVSNVSGSTVTVSNLSGKLGKVAFVGVGSGTLAGQGFTGGNLVLGNAGGVIDFKLGRSSVVVSGSTARLTFVVTATGATGQFVKVPGASGAMTLTIVAKAGSVPTVTLTGSLTSYSAAGGKELGYS